MNSCVRIVKDVVGITNVRIVIVPLKYKPPEFSRKIHRTESQIQWIIAMYLRRQGLRVGCEVPTNNAPVDIVVQVGSEYVAIELKISTRGNSTPVIEQVTRNGLSGLFRESYMCVTYDIPKSYLETVGFLGAGILKYDVDSEFGFQPVLYADSERRRRPVDLEVLRIFQQDFDRCAQVSDRELKDMLWYSKDASNLGFKMVKGRKELYRFSRKIISLHREPRPKPKVVKHYKESPRAWVGFCKQYAPMYKSHLTKSITHFRNFHRNKMQEYFQ